MQFCCLYYAAGSEASIIQTRPVVPKPPKEARRNVWRDWGGLSQPPQGAGREYYTALLCPQPLSSPSCSCDPPSSAAGPLSQPRSWPVAAAWPLALAAAPGCGSAPGPSCGIIPWLRLWLHSQSPAMTLLLAWGAGGGLGHIPLLIRGGVRGKVWAPLD